MGSWQQGSRPRMVLVGLRLWSRHFTYSHDFTEIEPQDDSRCHTSLFPGLLSRVYVPSTNRSPMLLF